MAEYSHRKPLPEGCKGPARGIIRAPPRGEVSISAKPPKMPEKETKGFRGWELAE